MQFFGALIIPGVLTATLTANQNHFKKRRCLGSTLTCRYQYFYKALQVTLVSNQG